MVTGFRGGLMDMRLKKSCLPFSDVLLTTNGALTLMTLLVCGIYIDLNQIRVGETLTPESSTHTSAYDRIARAPAAAGC